MTSLDELGPVDYVVVEFPAGEQNFTGEMADELVALVEAGTIRVIDVLILTKNEDGSVDAAELSDIEELGELEAIEAELAELLAADDVEDLAAAMDPGSVAGVLIYENLWAAPFASAARRAGGQLIADGRIPIQAIIASIEADEQRRSSDMPCDLHASDGSASSATRSPRPPPSPPSSPSPAPRPSPRPRWSPPPSHPAEGSAAAASDTPSSRSVSQPAAGASVTTLRAAPDHASTEQVSRSESCCVERPRDRLPRSRNDGFGDTVSAVTHAARSERKRLIAIVRDAPLRGCAPEGTRTPNLRSVVRCSIH